MRYVPYTLRFRTTTKGQSPRRRISRAVVELIFVHDTAKSTDVPHTLATDVSNRRSASEPVFLSAAGPFMTSTTKGTRGAPFFLSHPIVPFRWLGTLRS